MKAASFGPMKLDRVFSAIVRRRDAINAAFIKGYGIDVLRLLAFIFGHALTLNMPGLGTGNCNACILHALLFFNLRHSTGQATYHGLSTLYGHIAGAAIGMTALYLFPANNYRLVVFTVLATVISAFMQNKETNFFGLICIIFMSSVILGNWETPYADVQVNDVFSDFYGTCAAVAASILFHFVYPMPSSRRNLLTGLAERIRGASQRTLQYTDHLMNLYRGSTDRDYIGSLEQSIDVLTSCVGPDFKPREDIFEMRSELDVTQRELDAARHVVDAVDSLFIAVESMAMPLCARDRKPNVQAPQPHAPHTPSGENSQKMRRSGFNLQTEEEIQAIESESRRYPIAYNSWDQWRQNNSKDLHGKQREVPRLKALQKCQASVLLELAGKLDFVCENAPMRRFDRIDVEKFLKRAYDCLLSEDEDGCPNSESVSVQLLHSPIFLRGGDVLDAEKIFTFYDSISNDFLPLFAHDNFNSVFSNDQDLTAVLCGMNGMQLLQETAMCVAPLRCWCSIAALLYTLSSTYMEGKSSFLQSLRHYALRCSRILAAPITAIFGVVLCQMRKIVKDPKKYWKKHFRSDMGDGLFLLKFGIGLLLLNVPVIFIPGLDEVFNNHHGSWVVFSYMFCLDKTRESSFRNSLYRLLATACAGLLGLCAVFILDYSETAFNVFCTVGIGCIAGGVKGRLRSHMSTFLSAFIVCVSCPITYGSEPSYSNMLHRVLSVMIGGAVAVFVSSYLWPISAYKRVKIEIASAVKRITESLQRTEPYTVNDVQCKTAPSDSASAGKESATSIQRPPPATTSPSNAPISAKKWLRAHLRNEISVHEPENDSSLNSTQLGEGNISEISGLLSESFSSLRQALYMLQMIEIAKNARAKAIMSRFERQYDKIDQVREELFLTLLLHMSVSMSVQAVFRPPVRKEVHNLGFYASLNVLEKNYNNRNPQFSDRRAGDFERVVKSELRSVIVLLHAWEAKVWPKQKRLCSLADSATCVANSHCLLIQKNVDDQLDTLTSCEDVSPRRKPSLGSPTPLPGSPTPVPLHDDILAQHVLVRSEVQTQTLLLLFRSTS